MNCWIRTRALPAALCLLIVVMAGVGIQASDQSAASLYKAAQAAEAKDDVESAYRDYYKAYQKNPEDLHYKAAYYRSRLTAASLHVTRGNALREKGDYNGALTEYLRALEIDPSTEIARQEIENTRQKLAAANPVPETSIPKPGELGEVASPVQLKPISNDPITLHMSEDTKVVYQSIGKAAGINVLFDPEYTSKRIQIDLANTSLFDALRIVGTVSGTFWRPVTSNTIFVAQNTRAKRTELDEQAVQTFYLANASQQNDLNDIQTALRNVLANAKLYGVPSQNAIVMRGTPDELALARKLINDLDMARPEVVVDVAVLEVNRDKLKNIGVQLPGTATVSFQSSPEATKTTTTTGSSTSTTGSTTSSLTLNTLAHLNANNFAVTIASATANLLMTDSDTRILQNPRIRATDNQKATMKIGSRIPVATGSFSNGVSGGVGSALGTVQTQFQYLDVGVNIDMTPVVHSDRDVTLKLRIEVSSQSGSVIISNVTEPIISQRTIEQTIRLKEGEANILGGILTKQDSRNIAGTPGLGELPILRYFFSTNAHEVQNDEIVFLLMPHVVRSTQLSLLNTREIDTGTGSTVEIRREPVASVVPVGADLSAMKQMQTAANAGAQVPASQVPQQPMPQPGQIPPPPQPQGQSAAGAAENAAKAMQQQPPFGTVKPVALSLVPGTSTQKTGSTFQVAVNLTGGKDVFSVPMQVTYSSDKLTLINVDSGSFLGRDGQAVALVHRDDGAGNVNISATRPPGTAGMDGEGTVCVLTFQAKAAGDASVEIVRPGTRNSQQQPIETTGSRAVVHVQ